MIVYAGQSSGDLDDLWSLNLDTYKWNNLSPASRPKARHFPAITDAGRDQLVMFGGTGGGPLGDTWQFDLSTQQWKPLLVAESPPARYGHAMVYLPQFSAVWMFGGTDGAERKNDCWLLNDL